MNDVADAKKAKERSPNFPFISLEAALERARQFYAEEKRGAAPFNRVVLHWNYSPASSGALQTVGALKIYGLLVEVGGGSGAQRTFQLTDMALRVLLDQRPDSVDRDRFLKEAAISPPLAQELYAKWIDGIPSTSTINHILVLEKRFSEVNAVKVGKILVENHRYAKLSSSINDSQNLSQDEEFSISDKNEKTVQTQSETAPREMTRQNATPARMVNGHTEVVFLPDEKSMSVQFSVVPGKAEYEMLKSFVDWKLTLYGVIAKPAEAAKDAIRKDGEIKA